MREAKAFESGNVVRGFSLVLRDPEGSRATKCGVKKLSDSIDKSESRASAKLKSF